VSRRGESRRGGRREGREEKEMWRGRLVGEEKEDGEKRDKLIKSWRNGGGREGKGERKCEKGRQKGR
jgi:hypothetical protein